MARFVSPFEKKEVDPYGIRIWKISFRYSRPVDSSIHAIFDCVLRSSGFKKVNSLWLHFSADKNNISTCVEEYASSLALNLSGFGVVLVLPPRLIAETEPRYTRRRTGGEVLSFDFTLIGPFFQSRIKKEKNGVYRPRCGTQVKAK
jgi:hypothetical protein